MGGEEKGMAGLESEESLRWGKRSGRPFRNWSEREVDEIGSERSPNPIVRGSVALRSLEHSGLLPSMGDVSEKADSFQPEAASRECS